MCPKRAGSFSLWPKSEQQSAIQMAFTDFRGMRSGTTRSILRFLTRMVVACFRGMKSREKRYIKRLATLWVGQDFHSSKSKVIKSIAQLVILMDGKVCLGMKSCSHITIRCSRTKTATRFRSAELKRYAIAIFGDLRWIKLQNRL